MNKPIDTDLSDIMLHTESLTIGYHSYPVAQAINLSIDKQQITGLLGANGAGKSTFFRTLLRLIPTLAGNVYLSHSDNRLTDISQLSVNQLADCIGYVPQLHRSMPNFTVLDMVLMGRASKIGMFSKPGHLDEAMAQNAIDTLKINHLTHRYFHELSGGEQQLVLIARSLAQEPSLLIMDEPTASLDFGNQILVLECILALKQAGYGIIFSTHRPEHIEQVCDNLLVLKDHTITQYTSPNDFMTINNLADLYHLTHEQIHKYLFSSTTHLRNHHA